MTRRVEAVPISPAYEEYARCIFGVKDLQPGMIDALMSKERATTMGEWLIADADADVRAFTPQ